MRHKGFTLIELLAVIVILAIIALIATPIVLNIIKNSRVSGYERSLEGFNRSITYTLSNYRLENSNNIENGDYTISEFESRYGKIEYNGTNITDCIISIENKGDITLKNCKVNGVSIGEQITIPDPPQITSSSANFEYVATKLESSDTSNHYLLASVTATSTTALTYEYYYKRTSGGDYTKYTRCDSTSNSCYIANLEDYYSYTVKVVVKDSFGGEAFVELDGGSYCFVAGTKVLTDNGFKNIEDIKVGDMVMTLNLDNNLRELNKVTETFINKTKELYEVKVNGKTIKATPKHQFYVVDKGWIRAYNLKAGDILDTKDLESVIESVKYIELDKAIDVYNMTVENSHNYLITEEEVLVHNAPSI